MSRRPTRKPRFPWSPRAQAASLLLAWCASLLLPVFHFDGAEDGHESSAFAASAERCSGLFEHVGPGAQVVPACPDGRGCENPWHHHHPVSHHDSSQCPVCSSLLERIAEIPIQFCAPPALIEHCSPPAPRLPPLSERLAVALARGPPPARRAV